MKTKNKKTKVKNNHKGDKYDTVLALLHKGHGLDYIYKELSISLEDIANKSQHDNSYKIKLGQAVSAYKCFWFNIFVDKSYDANNREINRIAYEICVEDCNKINNFVLNTVNQVQVLFIDNKEELKKKSAVA